MDHVLSIMMIGSLTIGQILVAGAAPAQNTLPQTADLTESAQVALIALPAVPPGKSTIMGGEIRKIDFVRDQFMLKVYGQGPLKILFDERTQVFLDGKKIKLRDLHTGSHASVQTVLDKTNIFALSIHMLSQVPEGEYQGRVLNFNPSTSELTLSSTLSPKPINILLPANTPVLQEGQSTSALPQLGPSDLKNGSQVEIKFKSGKQEKSIASKVTILATPGTEFLFNGNLSFLDMHTGYFVLIDPRDGKDYRIFFDSAQLPATQNLHVGDVVKVKADYDGQRYVASAIGTE